MWKNAPTRDLMTAILNEIIPASADGNIPAAGDLGVLDFIEQETEKDERLLSDYQRGLERVKEISGGAFASLPREQRVAILKQVEQEDKDFFQLLIRHTYMGYYSRGDIRAKLNLSAEPVHPKGYEVAPETPEQMEELTRPVMERGACYRAVYSR